MLLEVAIFFAWLYSTMAIIMVIIGSYDYFHYRHISYLHSNLTIFLILSVMCAISFLAYTAEIIYVAFTHNATIIPVTLVIQYIGISFLPLVYLMFTLSFLFEKITKTTKIMLLLLLVGSITDFLLILTNEFHHLLYTHYSVEFFMGDFFSRYNRGPLFFYHLLVVYGCLIFIYCFQVYNYVENKKSKLLLYQNQARVLIIGSTILLIISFFFFILPFPVSLLPIGMFLAVITIAYGYRAKLFTFIPTAREKVIDHILDGYIILDYNLNIIEMNSVAKEYINAKERDMTSKNFQTVLKNTFSNNPKLIYLNTLLEHISIEKLAVSSELTFDFEIIPPLNKKKWSQATVKKIFDSKTQIILGYIIIFHDISESKRAEKIKENNHEYRNVLFSMLSHDLKNHLSVIQGYTFLALNENTPKAIIPDHLNKINDQLQKCNELITSTINLYRIKGLYEEDLRPFKLEQAIYASIVDLKELSNSKAIQIQVINDYPTNETPEIEANNILESIFYNLIHNAIKFSPNGSNITIIISLNPLRSHWIVTIEDEGEGIPENYHKDLFQPFKRFSSKDTTGSGLGLFSTKKAVELIYGEISYSNRNPHGARFTLMFPIYSSNNGNHLSM